MDNQPNQPLKLLAIFPHPDDETLGCGGTLARCAAEGVETYLVCATRGQRGWTKSDEPHPGYPVLGQIREAELRCAGKQLGLHEITLLDYLDGDIDQAGPDEIIQVITSHIRRVRPQVVITFAPDGAYGHPDHIALGQFVTAALVCAADGQYPDPRPPHRVSKLYYMVDSKSIVDTVEESLEPIRMDVDGVIRSHFAWPDWAITTRIDIRPYFDRTWQAILCHQSQLPGLGDLLSLSRETLLRIWGEGTFIRAYSLVNAGRKTETDLFEGLR